MMKRAAVVLAFVFAAGCASTPRRMGTVSVVSSHAVLSAIQDTEGLLVCGRPTAPQAPQCVPLEKHREIAAKLETAFELEGRVARIVRALPAGAGQPADVGVLMAQISGLVQSVLVSLPPSKQAAALNKQLEAR